MNEPTSNSYQTFISSGGDGSDLLVNAIIQSGNVSACNLLLYFQVSLSVIQKSFRIDFLRLLSYLFNFTGVRLITLLESLESKNGELYRPIFSLPFLKAQ